jgi:hypothetical protein
MQRPLQSVFQTTAGWEVPTLRSSCSETTERRFGPISNCRFDFTLFFEQCFLSSLPSLAFLLFSPLFFYALSKEKEKVVGRSVRLVKLVSSLHTSIWLCTL